MFVTVDYYHMNHSHSSHAFLSHGLSIKSLIYSCISFEVITSMGYDKACTTRKCQNYEEIN